MPKPVATEQRSVATTADQVLDQETLQLIQCAQPLRELPHEMAQDVIGPVVPLRFEPR